MAYYLYVSLMDEERIDVYTMAAASGQLELAHQLPLDGGPAALAIAPDKKHFYAVRRRASQLAAFAVDRSNGALRHLGTIDEESDAVYLTIDNSGRHVLTSSNGGARASSYRIGEDGTLNAQAACTVYSLPGAHSVEVHPSDEYLYVPHCISQNAIFQHKYDNASGQITPQDLAILVPPQRLGPRHIRFHPSLNLLYTTDEQGNSITAYPVGEDGRLSAALQTISTLPAGADASGNSTSQLRVHPSGRFLYAPNRGDDTIACFAIDADSGRLSAIGHIDTEPHVRGIDIDPQGRFFFAAGVESGQLAAYSIDPDSGELTRIGTYAVGANPMWVLATEL